MQDSLEDFIKLTRNVKEDESAKISKEMQITAQFKKECDLRAMKIVEFSIEGKLKPEVLFKCLPFINQEHYQDIVEERAITKLCGYPICGKKIPEMPKKQYLISTKSNKVYDITERKNFCSNFCYKASLHLKMQIGTSPLWLRKLEDIPDYNLLHVSEGGLPGVCIEQGIVKPVTMEPTFTSISSFTEVGLDDLIDNEIYPNKISRDRPKSFKKSKLKNTMQTINENEVVTDQAKKVADLKSNNVKKLVKNNIKNEVATCKTEVLKKGAVINLPAIEENEEQKENNLDKNKIMDGSSKDGTKKNKENINISNTIDESEPKNIKLNTFKNTSADEERLKSIDFVNKLQEILPNMPESFANKDLINDVKSVQTNITIKNKSIQENKELIVPNYNKKHIIGKSIMLDDNLLDTNTNPEGTTINTTPSGEDSKVNPTKTNIKECNKTDLDLETVLKNAIHSWLTLDTCIFIHGETKVKEILNEQKLSDYFEELNMVDSKREQQMKYMEICRRLQLQEMADEKFDKALTGNHKLEPLPDYKHLKQEAKDLTVKVKSFFQGEMYEEADKNFPTKVNKTNEEEEEGQGPPAVLPAVDFNNQNLMRRKIFLNSMNKAMHQLLQSLGISYYSSVLSDLQALVKTFKLKADNITFKPNVWLYFALVLLHMLALRDSDIREELEDRRSQEYIEVLCEVFPNKQVFISDILSGVQNIELFVENYIKKANV